MATTRALAGILGGRLAPDDALASSAALAGWMRREVTPTNHLSGPCRMGPPTDPLAVVDQAGCGHGLAALRVADLSIVPDCVRANTDATAMVIGERVAALIAGA